MSQGRGWRYPLASSAPRSMKLYEVLAIPDYTRAPADGVGSPLARHLHVLQPPAQGCDMLLLVSRGPVSCQNTVLPPHERADGYPDPYGIIFICMSCQMPAPRRLKAV